jgi:hypothetical protein
MRAFWKYETFPFVLSAPVVGDIRKGGLVKVEGYGDMLFMPIALLNDEEGWQLSCVIDAIRIDYEVALRDLHNKMLKRVRDAAPFVQG